METHVFRVSGAFELPLVVAQSLKNFDAAIALGVVIRGDTAHFDYICQSVTDGLTRVVLDERKPVGFGVLMVENEEQALVRCHKDNNKGAESAEAVLLSLQKLLEIKG
jgi:6,7-dimethyl-8-ribityllumazine synthase